MGQPSLAFDPGSVTIWCDLLATAVAPPTVANQGLPQNQWIIHPLVDGCQPGGVWSAADQSSYSARTLI